MGCLCSQSGRDPIRARDVYLLHVSPQIRSSIELRFSFAGTSHACFDEMVPVTRVLGECERELKRLARQLGER